MKRIHLLITLILVLSGIINAQQMDYKAAWKKVDELVQKSLPQSALEEVGKIKQQALKEKNSPQIIKAWMQQTSVKQMIDTDSLVYSLQEMETYTLSCSDKVEKSVLYSVMAKMYQDYFNSNRYKIRNRKNLANHIPEDVREWSSDNFMQKISEYVSLSLKEADALQKTDASTYSVLLEQGKDARFFRPTMYDFLAHQGIDLLTGMIYYTNSAFEDKIDDEVYFSPVNQFISLNINSQQESIIASIALIYQDLLKFRNSDSNKEALLMADLDRLQFVYEQSNVASREELYINALEGLEKQWTGKEISVEILYKKAMAYQSKYVPFKTEEERKQADAANKQIIYDICQKGIAAYPNYIRIGLLKNLLDDITQPNFQIYSESSIYPNASLNMKISSRNLDKLNIKICKVNKNVVAQKEYNDSEFYKNGEATLIKELNYTLKNDFPYQNNDTIFVIPIEKSGLYEYVITADKKTTSKTFRVTRLASLARKTDKENVNVLVVDRISGKPIENAEVRFYDKISAKNPSLVQTVKTDKNGLATFSGKQDIQGYQVVSGEEKTYLNSLPWSAAYNFNSNAEQREVVSIFTDRTIYRPGQTVFFKAISWIANDNASQVLPNKSYEVIFKDANQQEIAKKSLRTNEYGSLSGEFIIPQQTLAGRFFITIANTTQNITVEEYKRPNFKIDFEKIETTYSFGDSISVKGTVSSFSGVPLQQVDVNYRVVRRPHYLYRWMPFNRTEKQLVYGTSKLNDDGSFTVTFSAEKEKNDAVGETFYQYEIYASVTDVNGETQENRQYVVVGDKSMYLQFSLSDKINKSDNISARVTAKNLNEMPIQTSGTYTLYSLLDKGLNKDSENPEIDVYTGIGAPVFKIDKEIESGRFTTDENLAVNWIKLASGRYRIVAKALDSKGNEITDERDFILYDNNDKRPPVSTYSWLSGEKRFFKEGKDAEFTFGSSAKDVSVLYEIFSKNKVLERKRFALNNENKKFTIPYKNEYGDQITVVLTFVKDEKPFMENINLFKEKESKNLNLKFSVFRDKLLPGQKEEWKLTVSDAAAKGVLAEVLAGMYDMSLDQIMPHEWYFSPEKSVNHYNYTFRNDNGFDAQSGYLYFYRERKNVPELKYDYLPYASLQMAVASPLGVRVRGLAKSETFNEMEVLEEVAATDMAFAPASPVAKQAATGGNAGQSAQQQVQIRENFNETAFFYPHLMTNEQGETIISFTVPEGNTSWKFMGIAHTKELKYGKLLATTVTQKDLMVMPNMPRFLRQGDKTTISTKIANLSENALAGKAYIEFFNPETNQPIELNVEKDVAFNIEQNGSASASWTFDVPKNVELIGCRIIADGGSMSDGEQHILPVLSNQLLITESLPMNVRGNQSKTFTLSKLAENKSNTLSNYRLTLEFTENPMWYAVQALPTLTNPTSDNAMSWFGAYYVNVLSQHIARSYPEIKTIVDVWKKQNNDNAQTSNLEKNQELKSVLLAESPWVLDAKNETEQKQQLSLLFDENRQSQLNATAMQKLKELQHDDGGWMWFKGMYPNRYVTTYILENMHRLVKMSAIQYDNDAKVMQMNALKYLDEQIANDYNVLLKSEKDLTKKRYINDMQMYYLCVRSGYLDIPITGDALKAFKFYGEQAEKYRNELTLYGKAQAIMYFKWHGKKAITAELMQSLKEHASKTEEMGMFWTNNTAGYFWNQSPIAVQATIMEAFNEMGESGNELNEMKIWLLKQKQTQAWDAVPSTVNAIYALLKDEQELISKGENLQIQLGKEQIDMSSKEAGTGYIKQSFDKQEITPDMGRVSVTKSNDGIAWGALYWQYYEELDKVTKQQSKSFSVEKKLFVERTSASGTKIEPVSENNVLKTGDKAFIRLTIKTDRDMEYVHLKDLRAACFEPAEQLSGIRWKDGLLFYQEIKDASTNFYFNYLPKGTYVFEYPVWINRSGEYSGGIATLQCMYAPEFVSHTQGGKVVVAE